MNKKPIIIISGEPYSIFFELLFKIYQSDFLKSYKFPLIIIGSKKMLEKQMKKLKYKIEINTIEINTIDKNDILSCKLYKSKINLVNVNFNFKQTFAKISKKSNTYIKDCFDIGLKLMKKKIGYGIINGPISKQHFLDKKYSGITEYISNKIGMSGEEVMLIYNKNLSVVPITTHIPLKKVPKEISINKITKKIETINQFFITKLSKKPKFVITGLNPHCETTSSLSEERSIIIPSIRKLKKNKIKIVGPISADTAFLKSNLQKYDVIVGMYHDQVLTPIKALFEFDAINITTGLNFIRISPDHGTNNEMLGKNLSNELSLKKSLSFFSEINDN